MRPLLFGLLILLAGCGGDDAIPLSEYVTRADAICRDVVQPTIDAKSEQEIVDVQRSAMEKLEELPRPEDRQQDVEAFEKSMRELIDSLEEATHGDDAAAQRNLAQGDKTAAAAKDLGMKVCAQGTG